MLSPRKYGCTQCGKIGCDHVTVEEAMRQYEPPHDSRRGELSNLCPVCRRDRRLCICTSHVPVKPMLDIADRATVATGRTTRPYDKAYVEVLVNEGLNLYYQRDAEGLARWLRRVLP